MSLEISAGAGMEAIIFGIFGVKIEEKKLTFKPFNHEDIGEAALKDFIYKDKTYAIHLGKKYYTVYQDNKSIGRKFYGESLTISY